MEGKMRAVIYTRVSSEEQVDNHSLSAQAELARSFAEQRDMIVTHVYEERGRSAKTTNRPQFQQMIQDAKARKFDVLIVHKMDRLTRSVGDLITHMKLLNDYEITVASVTEPNMDYSTPIGRMQLQMVAVFAEWYVNNLSAETSKGKRERARKGSWNGTLPFGYTNLRRLKSDMEDLTKLFENDEIEEGTYRHQMTILQDTYEESRGKVHETDAIPDPVNASGVKLAFETYAKGIYSDIQIANLLTQEGYRTTGNWGNNVFGRDTITPMLKNRFYVGETSYQGKQKGAEREWQPGNHEPLISEELFDEVQKVRAKRAKGRGTSRSRKKKRIYPLSSLLVCAVCGTRFRGWALKHKRYRDPAPDIGVICASEVRSVRADQVEQEIAEIIYRLVIPDDWQESILHKLGGQQQNVNDHQQERLSLEGRLERAKNLYVMGHIDEHEYKDLFEELQNHISNLPVTETKTIVDLRRVSALLSDSQALWDAATDSERKMWLLALFNKAYAFNGHICVVEPTPILSALLGLDENTSHITVESGRQIKVVEPGTSLATVQWLLNITTPDADSQ